MEQKENEKKENDKIEEQVGTETKQQRKKRVRKGRIKENIYSHKQEKDIDMKNSLRRKNTDKERECKRWKLL